MKYIKTYENKNGDVLLKEFAKNIKIFVLDFFNDEELECETINYLFGKILRFGVKNPQGDFMSCFFVELKNENLLKINISEHYIGIKYYEESVKLKNYLISVIEPFSTYYDKDKFYLVKFSDVKELMSKISMEEYNFRTDANIYNL